MLKENCDRCQVKMVHWNRVEVRTSHGDTEFIWCDTCWQKVSWVMKGESAPSVSDDTEAMPDESSAGEAVKGSPGVLGLMKALFERIDKRLKAAGCRGTMGVYDARVIVREEIAKEAVLLPSAGRFLLQKKAALALASMLVEMFQDADVVRRAKVVDIDLVFKNGQQCQIEVNRCDHSEDWFEITSRPSFATKNCSL